MGLIRICDLEVAPPVGSLKEFKNDTLEVLVINVDRKYYCTGARCPHAGGAPLAEGSVEGIVLSCPWHGAQFRVTDGKLLKGPAKENLIVYRTVVKDNQIFVEVNNEF